MIETNGWFTTAADEAALALERKKKSEILEAIPEYQKSERDRIWLCDFISLLLFDEEGEFNIVRPRPFKDKQKQSIPVGVAYQMGRVIAPVTKSPACDTDGYETKEYRDFCRQANRINTALRRYSSRYRYSQWNDISRGREHADEDFGEHNMDILRKGFKRGSASFDVGSSLYLYQQMYDRKLANEPSLSKAAWLVKNAPMRKPVAEKPRPRGKWQIIQEQWRSNVENAHYWAALVAVTGSPLQYSENLLFDVVCVADVDHLKRLARTFYEFRQRASAPRVAKGRRTFLEQIPVDVPNFLAEVAPYSPLDITNPLEEYQWAALSRYGKKPPC